MSLVCRHTLEQDNPHRRSRLSGTNTDKPRYRHAPGTQCGCKKRSIPAKSLEADFIRLVGLLTVKEEALSTMLELAVQSEHNQVDDQNLDTQKKAAIAKHKRRIEAARLLYEDGDLSREEYLKRKQENERMIVHWEARTSEVQKKALELKTCLGALNQLIQLWERSSGEDRLALARGLFEYLVVDLTTQKISDFRLHPWADQYLILRGEIYENEEDSGNKKHSTTLSSNEAFHDPNGCWNRTFTLAPARYSACA